MSVELFLNEVLARQEDRDLLMANPKILEEGERIAHYVKTQQMVITEMAPGLLPLAVLAHLTQHALDVNAARGISREITMATLRDVNVWLDGYYEQEGVRAFGEYCWLRNHFTGDLFKLGRLQFRLECAAHFIPEGKQVIETHIPRGGRLTKEDCLESFAMAKEFFAKHFPEHDAKYFFCDSWLLSPDLQEIMEPDANILQFSKLWDHIPFHPDHSEQAVRHLYGVNYKREDVVNAPEHTSLQRKAKARILAGGDINIGAGMRKI